MIAGPSMSERLRPEHVRHVRLGHGANCSSVGSVIDTLFLSAAAGAAIFAVVCAAVEDEKAREPAPEGAVEEPEE